MGSWALHRDPAMYQFHVGQNYQVPKAPHGRLKTRHDLFYGSMIHAKPFFTSTGRGPNQKLVT